MIRGVPQYNIHVGLSDVQFISYTETTPYSVPYDFLMGNLNTLQCHDNSKYLEKVWVTQQEQANTAQLTWNRHFSKKITCLL